MQPIVLTRDLDTLFFPTLDRMAEDLSTPEGECNPLHLAAVAYSESGLRASAWNDNPKSLPPEKRWNASGIIQFMPYILPGLGWTQGDAAFRTLTATDQLSFARRYFSPYRGMLTSIGAIYTAVFLPALVSHAGNPDFVLTAKDGPLGWAYAPNAVFDADHNFAITVRELEIAVDRNCRGPRWDEIVGRLTESVAPPTDLDFDVRTVAGLQDALSRLGYSPGAADGIAGPLTHNAVVHFQQDHGLAVDGIYGPRTRDALIIALQTQA